jgi:hypothetical protein
MSVAESNKRRAKHGMYQTKTYRIWASMKTRCSSPNNTSYSRYGGRGIKVCDRWQEFENFYADMGDAPKGMTLDRVDVDGDYTPENCRWATAQEQQNNMRSNQHITYQGKTQTLAQWARELGLSYSALGYRYRNGWEPPELFSKENLKGRTVKHKVEYEGELITLKEAAKRSGIPMQTLYWRMRVGQPLF